MMRILIIEDEPLVAKDLERLLGQLQPDVNIVGVLSSIVSGRKWFAQHPIPDLIFSDIRLADGVSFELFESLKINCPVIFTTAYDEYALRAFKLNSIDYLLKPIDVNELSNALNKFKNIKDSRALEGQLHSLLAKWKDQPEKRYKERFLTLHRNAMVPINESEIAYFHKQELIHVHTISGEKYIAEHQTLDEIESLVNPAVFFRVNRQYLVHIQSVGKIKTTHKGLTLELKANTPVEVDISREKAAAFKEWVA